MYYEVFNKQGDYLQVNYPCFGALSCMGLWLGYEGIQSDGTRLPKTSVKIHSDVYGTIHYRKGFRPEELSHVKWYVELAPYLNKDFAWDLVERCIAEHAVFKGIETDRENNVITFSLGNRKMDETLLPVFILRDFLEDWGVQKAFTYIKENFYIEDDLTTMLLCPICSSFVNYKGEEVLSFSWEDGCYAAGRTAVGHIVDFITQRKLPEFYDKTWEDSELGYASYGTTPTYFYDECDLEVDEEEEEVDIFDNVEGVPTPINPYTNQRSTIDSCVIARHYDELSPEERDEKNGISVKGFINRVLALL